MAHVNGAQALGVSLNLAGRSPGNKKPSGCGCAERARQGRPVAVTQAALLAQLENPSDELIAQLWRLVK